MADADHTAHARPALDPAGRSFLTRRTSESFSLDDLTQGMRAITHVMAEYVSQPMRDSRNVAHPPALPIWAVEGLSVALRVVYERSHAMRCAHGRDESA